MLVCAEDLGMIPACVPAVMDAHEILSLEIQRHAQGSGHTVRQHLGLSLPLGMHHIDPRHGGIRQWWEENRDITQRYYNEVLREPGEAPVYAEPWICDKILSLNLNSPSMLAIFPLQDWLSASGKLRRENPHDEQINVPGQSAALLALPHASDHRGSDGRQRVQRHDPRHDLGARAADHRSSQIKKEEE